MLTIYHQNIVRTGFHQAAYCADELVLPVVYRQADQVGPVVFAFLGGLKIAAFDFDGVAAQQLCGITVAYFGEFYLQFIAGHLAIFQRVAAGNAVFAQLPYRVVQQAVGIFGIGGHFYPAFDAESAFHIAHGYPVVLAAAHGEEAMSYFADNPDINLIITDYRMPVKDGLEVLKEVRKEKDKNSLGVIVMTSPSEKTDASIFLKNGASDFIAKPFSKEELICRVNNTIEAMENINKIANFANRDFLTGVYNRRFFYSDVEEYVQVAEETNEPYAFAMIDVDYFKKINDKYGHDGGDKVLKSIAKILNDNTKGSDIVARFGGEEFCVVLKKINKEEAVKFFVNLRAKVAENKVTIKKEKVKVTISIGVSFGNGHCEIDDMLEACDSALYTAKENGRNRVEIAL